jgi:uncharacterized protein (TIGR00255 family)
MPYSMTGFASVSKTTNEYEISIRIKSLNNKGIDIHVKGNKNILMFLDLEIRNIIKSYFERGSFQIFVELKYLKPSIVVELDALKSAILTVKNVLKDINLENVSGDKIYDLASNLASEMQEEVIDEEIKNAVLYSVKEACEELKKERKREGEKLIKDIEEKLKIIEENLEKIDEQREKIIEKAQERLKEKIRELLGEEYSERAFIEASLLADKMDITEEVVRLKSHIQRFKELLKSDEPVGRKMDFLCQEMHREINTMGNKMPDFSQYTVEMKTTLEKIRQQVQNIE